jgi:hypothetical protein
MMSHELWLFKNQKLTNITPIVGAINWQSHVDELGLQLDFDMAKSDMKHFPKNPLNLGDLIILKNKEEITRAVTVTEDSLGVNKIQYTSFDYAYYLNESDAIYQFNRVRADQAITKILNDFNVPIASIASMPTLINKIYPGDAVSEIIKDIIKQVEKDLGTKYRMEMVKGRMVIEKQSNLLIKGTFKPAINLGERNITDAISNPTRTRSINGMKNRIQIVSEDKLVFTLSDDHLIRAYGLLQDVYQVEQKDIAQAKNIAKNLLKEFGKVLESVSNDFPGDDRVRAGRLLEIEEPITGLKGLYLIKSANHTVSKGIHKMNVALEVV